MAKISPILRGAALAIPAATALVVGIKELTSFFEESGIYAQPLVLSGRGFLIKEEGVQAVHAALDANDREELLKAAKIVLEPIADFESSDLLTSFAPLLAPVTTAGFFKDMASGALVVMGESRSGKTTFIRGLKPDLIIRISEPVEADDAAQNAVSLADYRHAIGLAIAAAMSGRRVAVDSLRGLMYRLRGNAVEGGVSSGLFEVLTTINNVVASVGASVVFSVNPMTGDDSKLTTLVRRVEASVAGVVLMRNGSEVMTAYRTIDGRRISDTNDDAVAPAENEAFSNTAHRSQTAVARSTDGIDPVGGSRVDKTIHTVIKSDHDSDLPAAQKFPRLNFDN